MDKVCRICLTKNTNMSSLLKEYPNSMELIVEGEEFEYCFDLKVLEVADFIEICTKCQQKLHNFYLFKQQAIKSHYELLNKINSINKLKKLKVKQEHGLEIEIIGTSESAECDKTTNLEDLLNMFDDESTNDEFEEAAEEEIEEIEKISLEMLEDDYIVDQNMITVDTNDHKRPERSVDNIVKKEVTNKPINNSKNKRFKRSMGIQCEICGKNFILQETYEAHMNTHKGLPPYSCEICGKGFNFKDGVLYHMKNHNNIRDFVCEVCSKAFLTKFDLRTHMKCHSEEKQFICDLCGKLMRYHHELIAHRECHEEENKYECEICHLKLHTKRTLRGHMKACHEYYNPKLYCNLCEKQFTRKYRLVAHMKKLHPEKQLG